MQSTNNHLIKISLPLTLEEKDLEKSILQKKNVKLTVPPGFQNDIAWELANLTRVAYADYYHFNGSPSITEEKKAKLLYQDFKLYTSSNICNDRIDDYFIQKAQNATLPDEVKKTYGNDFYQYRILATYNYLSYSFKSILIPPTPEAHVDRFGFIAERINEDNERLIFVVFRGTMEPQEWFVNFQFKQLSFLKKKPKRPEEKSDLKVSLGFNKIYTDYRPGILQGEKLVNKTLNGYSQFVDEKARNRSAKKYSEVHALHEESILETVEKCFQREFHEQDKIPKSIYVTGHSLGGALATISALHLAQFLKLDLSREETESRIFLYTFASPRVGNQKFAEECSQKFRAYRIANSEDIVPGVPPGTFRVFGEEMLPPSVVLKLRKALGFITNGTTEDIFEHVGYPTCFTCQLGGVSSNHNINATYCDILR